MGSSTKSSDSDSRRESRDSSSLDMDKAGHIVEGGDNDRAEWGNHCEFFLSSLGLAVGLGNIWRFPYVAYANGGATFLIPYLLMLVLVGLPVFFLEMALGQYGGLSATKIYARLSPGVRGLGYGMILIPLIINFQYVVIMAYAMYYMFVGFTSTLPWSSCDPDFANNHCFTVLDSDACNSTTTFYNLTCVDASAFCMENGYTSFDVDAQTCNAAGMEPNSINNIQYRVSASEEYWYRHVLNIAVENGHLDTDINSWSKWGGIRWEIVGCLALSWLLICLSLIKGVASYGKVVYFTTLFPYVVLTILLGYVATLPGFIDGVEFYIVPKDWDKLLEINIWNDAAGQIFYSLSVAVGSQLLLASYNGFRNNCHRDALLIGLCNSLTSLYAGFTVFGVIGYIADAKGANIESVVTQGPGLAFIVYPEAVSLMAVSPLFSFLFFFMLNLLAISSVCGSWEALVAAIFDEFPQLKSKRIIVMFVSTFLAFLCGLSMCFDSGFLMFTLMDNRCSNAIVLMAFVEVIIVTWFYGVGNVMNHVADMGMKIPYFMQVYWKLCWVIIAPFVLIAVTILAWVDYEPDVLEDYEFPGAVQFMGWMLELFAVIIVVCISIYVVFKRWRAGKTVAFIRAGPMMQPTKDWGPRPDSGLPAESWRGKINEALEDDD